MSKVGIIAGAGRTPVLLAEKLEAGGIIPYIIAIDGVAEPSLYQGREHLVASIGMAGAMLSWLKQNGVRDIVLTGTLKRPEWRKLKVDARGMMIVAKVALKKLGDDGLLRVIRREIEADGMSLRGIQEFLPEMLAPSGVLGKVHPLSEDDETIRLGVNAAHDLGKQDKGQSVVVQQDVVLGLEDSSGTRALMEKCAPMKSVGRGPILVKLCKPQQDKSLDLPTIGPQTVKTAQEGGFAGIVVDAGQTLIIDMDETLALADQHGIFIQGIST